MLINYSLTALVAFLTGVASVILLKNFALKFKFLISDGIPLIGGIAMGLSFFLACLISFPSDVILSPHIFAIIFASIIILFSGIIDDLLELSVSVKFLLQIISTFILVFYGVKTQIINIGNIANIIITFIWILGITNAFNHLDVIDGLASGVAIIAGATFFIIALFNHDINSAVLSLALSAAAFSFMIFNFSPAKIYMGNSGSHFLGFVLGAIALLISYASVERKVALFAPLLILGFPIIDTTILIILRIKKRIVPFKKSNDHLALRFLAMGYSKGKALMIMFSWSLFFAVCGVLISKVNNLFGIFIITFVVFACWFLFKKVSKIKANA